jgi:hypothetical protein
MFLHTFHRAYSSVFARLAGAEDRTWLGVIWSSLMDTIMDLASSAASLAPMLVAEPEQASMALEYCVVYLTVSMCESMCERMLMNLVWLMETAHVQVQQASD